MRFGSSAAVLRPMNFVPRKILVNSDPLDVVKIFRLSGASYSKLIQHLWWAAGYSVFAIPLTAGVPAINAQLLRRASL